MNPVQWLIEYSPVAWLDALTAHQLDTIRTASVAIGSGLVPLLAFLLGWGIKILRTVKRDAEIARDQTAHIEYIDGKRKSISVVEYARHAAHVSSNAAADSESTRRQVGDLAGWVKGTGTRRLPTIDIPIQQESHYD